jgi:hypothetical protein
LASVAVDQIDRRDAADGVDECNGSAVGREDGVVVAHLGRTGPRRRKEQRDAPEHRRKNFHDLTLRTACVQRRSLLGLHRPGRHAPSAMIRS